MFFCVCTERLTRQLVGGVWTMTSSWRWQRWAKAPRNDDNILLNSTTDGRCNLFFCCGRCSNRCCNSPYNSTSRVQWKVKTGCDSCRRRRCNRLRGLRTRCNLRCSGLWQPCLCRFSCINYTVADPKVMRGWAPAKSVSGHAPRCWRRPPIIIVIAHIHKRQKKTSWHK